MEVDVDVQSAAETLDQCHRASLCCGVVKAGGSNQRSRVGSDLVFRCLLLDALAGLFARLDVLLPVGPYCGLSGPTGGESAFLVELHRLHGEAILTGGVHTAGRCMKTNVTNLVSS